MDKISGHIMMAVTFPHFVDFNNVAMPQADGRLPLHHKSQRVKGITLVVWCENPQGSFLLTMGIGGVVSNRKFVPPDLFLDLKLANTFN